VTPCINGGGGGDAVENDGVGATITDKEVVGGVKIKRVTALAFHATERVIAIALYTTATAISVATAVKAATIVVLVTFCAVYSLHYALHFQLSLWRGTENVDGK
jgi:hypothetical protein